MSANIRLLYDFLFDDATITSSSEVSTLPDGNVVHDFVAKIWRTTGDTAEWVKFDLGSAKDVKEMAIFGHNLTSGATVVLEANAADSWDSPSYTKALTWDERVIIEFLDQTYRWWRITFADASNPDEYIEIGRICAGVYFEPSYNYRDGWNRERVDPSEKEGVAGQQVYAKLREKFWRYMLHFEDISEADQASFEILFDTIGNTGYLVVSADPDDHPSDWTVYAQMMTSLAWAMRLLDFGSLDVTFEEQF